MKQSYDQLHELKKRKTPLSRFLHVAAIFATALLGGCSKMVLFNPKGPIGDTERFVIVFAFVLMLIVVIPVIIMAFWFPRKYRAGNTRSDYAAQMELFREDRTGHLAGPRSDCDMSGDFDLEYHLPVWIPINP